MQYLYRAFDSEQNLLYVGISGKWSERLHAHEKTSDWMEQTDWVKIERFPNRPSVEQAEREAIRNEKPIYNKVFSEEYESANIHWAIIKKTVRSGKAIDAHHQVLVDAIRETALEVYGCDPRKLKSAAIANLFFEEVEWRVYHTDYRPCRNCGAVWGMNFIQNSLEDGERQLLEEGSKNGAY